MSKSNSLMIVEHVGDVANVSEGQRSTLDYEFFENFTSEHTKTAYKNDLLQFFDYIYGQFGQLRSVAELSRIHVISYRNHLQASGGRGGKGSCPKTVIRKLAAIKSYCDFLVEKGLLQTNPATSVKRPADQVITQTNDLTDEQVRQLILSVDMEADAGPLHKAILMLMFSTGLRKSELIHLKLQDYSEFQGYKIIQFMGKRGKVNRVPLHPAASYQIDLYLQRMKNQGRTLSAGDWLFQPTRNHHGERDTNKKMNPTSIDFIVKKYCRKIGVTVRITPHSARDTVISSLLEHGCDLYRVAQLVNHSNVKTTQGYDKRGKKISDSPVFNLKFF